MIRLVAVAVAVAVAAVVSGCTLLLPTNELITPCTVQDDCEAGFICEDNACLPEDVDDGNASE
jgi:hypothetical protein